MPKQAHLVLEDGSVYRGEAFGAVEKSAYGEVVFNTSMTGYQEVLTDPSYAGQIVVPTYPLIGNYGVNERDFESKRVQVSGFVVRQHCVQPSHSLSTATVDEFLATQGVPGISGVDTRAITRRLRTHGVMMGIIAVDESPEQALSRLRDLPRYGDVDFVKQVSAEAPYDWNAQVASPPNRTASHNEAPLSTQKILVSDYGLKYNILRILRSKGCEVTAIPSTASAEDILSRNPDGVVLSPGPGDPELLDYVVATAKGLVGRVPIMGICLGQSGAGPRLWGEDLQAQIWPPRRQPSGAGGGHRPCAHYGPEPRLRRRRGQPALGGRSQPRQPSTTAPSRAYGTGRCPS